MMMTMLIINSLLLSCPGNQDYTNPAFVGSNAMDDAPTYTENKGTAEETLPL